MVVWFGRKRRRLIEMSTKHVEAECSSCGGTGVYCGFCEPPGTAVVCLTCDGTGCETISYRPFTGRKRKHGVKTVSQSQGRFIATGVGAVSNTTMTYKEFLEKF